MKPTKLQEATRRKVWKATKEAVGAYARNPCRATEIKVEAALGEVKRACSPCQPASKRPRSRKPGDRRE